MTEIEFFQLPERLTKSEQLNNIGQEWTGLLPEELEAFDLLNGEELLATFIFSDDSVLVRSLALENGLAGIPEEIRSGFGNYLEKNRISGDEKVTFLSDGVNVFFVLNSDSQPQLAAGVMTDKNGAVLNTIDWYDLSAGWVRRVNHEYPDEISQDTNFHAADFLPVDGSRNISISGINAVQTIRGEMLFLDSSGPIFILKDKYQMITDKLPLGVITGFEKYGFYDKSQVATITDGQTVFYVLYDGEEPVLAAQSNIDNDGKLNSILDWHTMMGGINSHSEMELFVDGYPTNTSLFPGLETHPDYDLLIDIQNIITENKLPWAEAKNISLVSPYVETFDLTKKSFGFGLQESKLTAAEIEYLRSQNDDLPDNIHLITITDMGVNTGTNDVGLLPRLTFIFDTHGHILNAIGANLGYYSNEPVYA